MSNWRELAECRYEDPDLFFPIGTSGPALLQTRRARAVCGRCRVRGQCLDFALTTAQPAGVWGGATEDERRDLGRARTRRRPS
ncbi:WhiB family transcriptional regulator [Streptomyces sp. NPDC047000]|uniref:WhiB family transcriptional regulator n=1 Tax=Streptomyces sp. NPDC047000 TaxID=3155474 RepID=UPI0033F34A86